MTQSDNIYWHNSAIHRHHREKLNGHRSTLLWFTGLSGAGKSTIAQAVDELLHQRECRSYVLDGDNVRHNLCADLGFSADERTENIRRIAEVSRLFLDHGTIVLTAFISPLRSDRAKARSLMPEGDFVEVYCNTPLDVCEQRDVKGLYRRARRGEIADFTGVSAPYEHPRNPELELDTATTPVTECAQQVVDYLQRQQVFECAQGSCAA